jgi:hypothetical protein
LQRKLPLRNITKIFSAIFQAKTSNPFASIDDFIASISPAGYLCCAANPIIARQSFIFRGSNILLAAISLDEKSTVSPLKFTPQRLKNGFQGEELPLSSG